MEDLVQEAIEAHKNDEMMEIKEPTPPPEEPTPEVEQVLEVIDKPPSGQQLDTTGEGGEMTTEPTAPPG